jgi:hypothetical protein
MASEGLDDILKTFGRLERAGQLRSLRSATNAALNPALRALRLAAPKGSEPHKTYKGRVVAPGFLSNSIKKSVRVSKDKTAVVGRVRVEGEAYYGAIIEKGYRKGRRSSKVIRASQRSKGGISSARLDELGDKRVKVAPRPWFNPTVKRLEKPTLDAYKDKMRKAILKEFNR